MLKDSILKFLKLDGVISNLTGYVEARVELLKIEIKEDLAKGLAQAAVFIVLAFAFTLFIFFISVAVALALGDSVGRFWGFAIVAGFYLLIAILLFALRDTISKWMEKQLLEITRKKKE